MKRRDFINQSALLTAGAAVFPFTGCHLTEAPEHYRKKVKRQIIPDKDVSFVSIREDVKLSEKEIEKATEKAIDLLGGMKSFISRGDRVTLKPNIGWARVPEQAATTNPIVIRKIIEMCYNAGASKVSVTDLPCNSASITFERTGIQKAVKSVDGDIYFPEGYRAKKIKLERPIFLPLEKKEVKSWLLYTDFFETDKLINVAIAKHHNLSKLTLGMKNWYGAISGRRNQLHQAIHESIASLAYQFKPDLTIIDAIRILLRNGPTGGSIQDTKETKSIIASRNQVAADSVATSLFGMKPEEIPFIKIAHEFELGNYDWDQLNIMKEIV